MTPLALGGILATGLLSGYVAARLLFGRGNGLLVNLLVGLMGGVLGAVALDHFGIVFEQGLLGMVLVTFLGALALLSAVGVLRKIAA